jgi:hypothetical protein
MTSSPGLMELSDPPEALSDPFGSFPLSDPTITLGDIEAEASSPTLPHANSVNPTATHNTAPLSSDFLEIPLSQANFLPPLPALYDQLGKEALTSFRMKIRPIKPLGLSRNEQVTERPDSKRPGPNRTGLYPHQVT